MNDIIKKINDNEILKTVRAYIAEGYLVGGFLRDLYLGKESCDLDFVVENNAKETALEIAQSLNAYFVPLDEKNGIYRVVMADKITYIDIAQCIGSSIEDDLCRRDFTINSLGFDIKNNSIMDKTGAIKDLEEGIIREISEKNMLEDPLRILRAYRFQSETGFVLSDSLYTIITKHVQELQKPAKERVNTELVKLFAGTNAVEAIYAMDKSGVLGIVLPEALTLKKIPPNTHHHLCLFDHCVQTVNHITKYLECAPDDIKKHFSQIEPALGNQKRTGYLKLAAFLHDIGKPQTWVIEPDTGRHRFIKHDDVGSKIVVEPLKRLKFSNKQIKYIQKLIKFHIYPSGVICGEHFTDKAVMRFFRKMENDVFDVIALAHSDRLSAQGPLVTKEIVENNINGLRALAQRYIDEKNKINPIEKLLNGQEIMELLNLKQGPRLGEVMKALYEAQMSGEVITKTQAVEFIETLAKN